MTYWRRKVALITGGSKGLGRLIAQALVDAGASVVIAARDQEQLAAAAKELCSSQGTCGWLPADVTQQDQVEALIAQVLKQHGRLDAVFHCAGKSDRGRIADTSADRFQQLLQLNFVSAVRVTTAALPHLLTARGHVVFLGSLAAKAASRYLGAYPASKFPLAAYAQQLRLELGPTGLHSLLICPGPIARPDAGQRYAEQAANLPESAQRPGGGVKLKGIDPLWLARRVLLACERREAELVVPARAKLLFALEQLSPRLGDWLVRRMTDDDA
jgi:NAD(P)-dependent dehydrogenase (short-subunit alcohol dehydrogenase family)